MATKDDKKQNFIALLHELFQLNQPELDFGIYRIMHARKDDINRFIEKDLPKIIADAFDGFQSQDKQSLQQELDKAISAAKAMDMDPDTVPKVQAIKEQLSQSLDLGREEGEVYDALITFFSRYYDEGDFVSRRVYKDGTYAIPYNGEEVVLHWANKDQYYIKSSETLRDYSFRLDPNNEEKPMRVHFKLVDADPGAQNNVKETDATKRIFILDSEQPWEEIDGDQGKELQLRFHYRATTTNDWTATTKANVTAAAAKKPPTQDHCRQMTVNALLGTDSDLPAVWKNALSRPYTKADGESADYPILQGQLNNYTKRNTFDYFIHKDLGGFLTRELDFYIKNELMRWEDIAALKSQPARLAPLLSKVEVIRAIGEKVVAFLAQLEDFQKKLWLKKKFVVDCQYCITLDRLADNENLIREVLNNNDQVNYWVNLSSIDKLSLKSDIRSRSPIELVAMDRYRHLMIDTTFFNNDFKNRLLASIDGIDTFCDGLIMQSENFQSLSFTAEKYSSAIQSIYIDPPYNTGEDGFQYKDGYSHSSWITLMSDRLQKAKHLLDDSGVVFCSIDDTEVNNLWAMLNEELGKDNYLGSMVWKRRSASGMSSNPLSLDHEYVLSFGKESGKATLRGLQKDESGYPYLDEITGKRYASTDLTIGATREQRPNQYYPITNPRTGKTFEANPNRVWRFFPDTMKEVIKNDLVIWPDEHEGELTRPRYKTYFDPEEGKSKPLSSWIENSSVNLVVA